MKIFEVLASPELLAETAGSGAGAGAGAGGVRRGVGVTCLRWIQQLVFGAAWLVNVLLTEPLQPALF